MLNLNTPGQIPDESVNIHVRAKMSWQQVNLKIETRNAAENFTLLQEMKEQGRVKSMSDMPKGKGPILLCGSGSSFNPVIKRLNEFPGPVWCSTSQAATIAHEGRPPDVVIAVDPNCNTAHNELEITPGGWDKTTYLTHPSAPPAYFRMWCYKTTQPIYLFRILEPSYDWYSFHMPAVYPWIKTALLPFIDAGASLISLAAKQGYDPIYLVGYDFGGFRFNIWRWAKSEWIYEPENNIVMDGPEGPGGLRSSEVMLYAMRGSYITAFMAMNQAIKPIRIYNLAEKTNMIHIPKCTFEDAIAGNVPTWSEEFKAEANFAIESYLAKNDTFMVPIAVNMGSDYRVYMLKYPTLIQIMMR